MLCIVTCDHALFYFAMYNEIKIINIGGIILKTIRKQIAFFLATLMALVIFSPTVLPSEAKAITNICQSDYLNELIDTMIRDRVTRFYIPNYTALDASQTHMVKAGWELERRDGNFFTVKSVAEIGSGYSGPLKGYEIYYKDNFTFPDGTVRSAEETTKIVNDFYDSLVADIPDDLDDVSKVLLLNLRLNKYTVYDYDSAEETPPYSEQAENSASLVGPAIQGMAVCSGYANAFKFLCDRVGITCKVNTVSYNSWNDHAANLVTVDGKDYVVDATHSNRVLNWVMCSADKYNYHCTIAYKSFLGADRQLSTAVNEEYDNAWWTRYWANELIYSNGGFYGLELRKSYVDGLLMAICRNGEEITQFNTKWFDNSPYYFSKICGCSGDAFYYNRADAIWKYNTKTGEHTKFFAPENLGNKKITNFSFDKGILRYLLTDESQVEDYSAYKEYSNNAENYLSVEIVDPDGHFPVAYGDEGDCAHSATSGIKCGVCGLVLTPATETGVMGPHKGEWTDCTATCTEAGSESRVCTICGETETREVPAKGHNYSPYLAANVPSPDNHDEWATCTQEGRIRELTCKDCGNVKPAQVVPKKAHLQEYFYNNNNLARTHDYYEDLYYGYVSCTRGGTVPGIRCYYCKDVYREPVDYPDGFGHDPVEAEPYLAPTCTKSGHEAKIVCSRCDEVLQSASFISPLWHDFQTLDTPEDHPATCTEDRYVINKRCTRCGEAGGKTIYTDTKGHVDEDGDGKCDDCQIPITADTKMRGWHPSGNNDSDGPNNQGGGSSSGKSGGFFAGIIAFFQKIIAFIKNLFSR